MKTVPASTWSANSSAFPSLLVLHILPVRPNSESFMSEMASGSEETFWTPIIGPNVSSFITPAMLSGVREGVLLIEWLTFVRTWGPI